MLANFTCVFVCRWQWKTVVGDHLSAAGVQNKISGELFPFARKPRSSTNQPVLHIKLFTYLLTYFFYLIRHALLPIIYLYKTFVFYIQLLLDR